MEEIAVAVSEQIKIFAQALIDPVTDSEFEKELNDWLKDQAGKIVIRDRKMACNPLTIVIFYKNAHAGARTKRLTSKQRKILDTRIEDLKLSVRSSNCLKYGNVRTVRELVVMTAYEFYKIRNFGRKSQREVENMLKIYDLTIGMNLD